MKNLREPQHGDRQISITDYRRLVQVGKLIANLQIDPRFFERQERLDSYQFILKGNVFRGFPFDKLAFGFAIPKPGIARIFSGVVEHGTKVFEVAEIDVSIPAGTHFVYVDYLWGNVATIPATVSVRPITTDTSFKKPLYQFTTNPASGATALTKIEWIGGNIHIPGAFAG